MMNVMKGKHNLKFLGRVALIGQRKGAVVLCLLAMFTTPEPIALKEYRPDAGVLVDARACLT